MVTKTAVIVVTEFRFSTWKKNNKSARARSFFVNFRRRVWGRGKRLFSRVRALCGNSQRSTNDIVPLWKIDWVESFNHFCGYCPVNILYNRIDFRSVLSHRAGILYARYHYNTIILYIIHKGLHNIFIRYSRFIIPGVRVRV